MARGNPTHNTCYPDGEENKVREKEINYTISIEGKFFSSAMLHNLIYLCRYRIELITWNLSRNVLELIRRLRLFSLFRYQYFSLRRAYLSLLRNCKIYRFLAEATCLLKISFSSCCNFYAM